MPIIKPIEMAMSSAMSTSLRVYLIADQSCGQTGLFFMSFPRSPVMKFPAQFV